MTTIACKYCRSLGAAVAVLIGELWAAQVHAADYDVGPIHIAQPWARATPKGAKSGAGYLTITNNGSTADRLSCVSSDASVSPGLISRPPSAGRIFMTRFSMVMVWTWHLAVMLKPSSPHLMFLGLKHPLEQGNTVAATLQFEKAGTTRSFQSPQSERRPPALPRARQHR
jgi:periplasmic copper chaperone A